MGKNQPTFRSIPMCTLGRMDTMFSVFMLNGS